MEARRMNHRERLETCLAGGKIDRPPVALWRHFPVDDQIPANLANAILDFQDTYDFDLVKVTPASSFCVKDWGVQDEWRGASEGTRDYTIRVIRRPEDWGSLPVLDPRKGHLADQLSCLRQIVNELDGQTPVIQTIFNPLSQAKNLVGQETLLVHLRQNPQAVHAGLKIIMQSTQRFIEAVLEIGIDGIFFAVQHAQYSLLSREEYLEFGKGYDLQILESARGLWLNLLHLHGENVMFDLVADYPVAIINWHDRDTPPSLRGGQDHFSGVVCGGLQREKTMVLGTPDEVMAEARDAILATGGERFILGTGCVIPITAPRGNILAARHSVEMGA
jgi:uroporphyrinogen decarboxylase